MGLLLIGSIDPMCLEKSETKKMEGKLCTKYFHCFAPNKKKGWENCAPTLCIILHQNLYTKREGKWCTILNSNVLDSC